MLAELQNPPIESPLADAQPQLAVVTAPKPKVKHLFTRQTAREAGRKGGKARAEKAAREKAEAEQKAQAPTLEAERYVELRIASESEGGWSVNDSWKVESGCDRETAIGRLCGRWAIFKLNYLPRARVQDIADASFDSEGDCLLEVDCTAFATVRKGGE